MQIQIPWRYSGVLIQGGMIAALLAVPMLYPDVLVMELPRPSFVFAPKRPVQMVTATRQQAMAPQTSAISSPIRPYNPVDRSRPTADSSATTNNIIDGPEMNFPFLAPPSVAANTHSAVLPDVGRLPAKQPPPPVVEKKPTPKSVAVGGKVQEAKLLHRVMPIYPPIAKQTRTQGTVKLQSIIAKDGTIQALQTISGHPFLVKAALEAVQQWRYAPTMLNGEAVEVHTTIEVNFVLSQ